MTEHRKANPKVGTRLKDLALYILICVLVLATVAGLAATGIKWDILFKLLQSLMFPIILFGIALPKRSSQWGNRKLWLTVGVALLIHALLFLAVASRVEHLKPAITAALAVPELFIWLVSNDWQMKRVVRTSK